MFRIKSMNVYGESPWSISIPVQTFESIITSDGIKIKFLLLYFMYIY